MLPVGNGMEILRRIKCEGLPAKVCVISGCYAEMFQEARACGADETLVNPVDVDYLLHVLSAPALTE
jgi:DNA-binding NarL/FixJ family response regulator